MKTKILFFIFFNISLLIYTQQHSSFNEVYDTIDDIESSFNDLKEEIESLNLKNNSLVNLLEQNEETIFSLRNKLDITIDRMEDAENGAINLLDINTELENQIELVKKDIEDLKKKNNFWKIVGISGVSLSFILGTILTIILVIS